MRVDLAQIVEEVRTEHFADVVDEDLAKEVLDIETKQVDDRSQAKADVARVIQRYVSGGARQ